jgi:endogenous inhibitor of DNA gyrase (YacG/DUF329 family)
VLNTEHPRCSYNTPILTFDGVSYRPSELNPDVEVIVPLIAKFGSEWRIVQKAIDAGYPIKMESAEEEKMQAYCMKCKKKVKIKNPKAITMKNKRPAIQGVCPICGTKVFRIGKS